MNSLSMTQALGLWSDLEAAYQGKHGFGGDVAEIYIYRAMPYEPSVAVMHAGDELNGTATKAYDRANTSLYNLLTFFAERQEASIEIAAEMDDGRPWRKLGDWLALARYTYRIHVRVTPREGRKEEVKLDLSQNIHAFAKQMAVSGANERQAAIVVKIREQAAFYQRQSASDAAIKTDPHSAQMCTAIANAIESSDWTFR